MEKAFRNTLSQLSRTNSFGMSKCTHLCHEISPKKEKKKCKLSVSIKCLERKSDACFAAASKCRRRGYKLEPKQTVTLAVYNLAR